MSVQPHITAAVGAPRAINIKFPAGNQVGESGKPIQQRKLLTEALESIFKITSPRTILQSPYRWRRFPISEEAVFIGESTGPAHPEAMPIGPALDELSDKLNIYIHWLQEKIKIENTVETPNEAYISGLSTQLQRSMDLLELIDSEALDQYREILNTIATLELRGQGRFV